MKMMGGGQHVMLSIDEWETIQRGIVEAGEVEDIALALVIRHTQHGDDEHQEWADDILDHGLSGFVDRWKEIRDALGAA